MKYKQELQGFELHSGDWPHQAGWLVIACHLAISEGWRRDVKSGVSRQ